MRGFLWDPPRVPTYYNFAWVPHTFGGSDPSWPSPYFAHCIRDSSLTQELWMNFHKTFTSGWLNNASDYWGETADRAYRATMRARWISCQKNEFSILVRLRVGQVIAFITRCCLLELLFVFRCNRYESQLEFDANREMVCCFVCDSYWSIVVFKAAVVMTTNWTHVTPDAVSLTTASGLDGGGGLSWRSALILIVFVFIIVGTVLGNTLVCAAVAIVRCLRTPSNLLIVSLAVSDLLVATLVMGLAAFYEVWSCSTKSTFALPVTWKNLRSICAAVAVRYIGVAGRGVRGPDPSSDLRHQLWGSCKSGECYRAEWIPRRVHNIYRAF